MWLPPTCPFQCVVFANVCLLSAHRVAALRAVSTLYKGLQSFGKRSMKDYKPALHGAKAFVLREVVPKLLATIKGFPSLSSHLTPLEMQARCLQWPSLRVHMAWVLTAVLCLAEQIWAAAEGVLYIPPDDGKDDFVPTIVTSKNVV